MRPCYPYYNRLRYLFYEIKDVILRILGFATFSYGMYIMYGMCTQILKI
jgi:hypothetical protein